MALAGRHIVILGMGGTALRKADAIENWLPDGCEPWSLNNAYLFYPSLRESHGFARFFELHSWNYLRTWSPGKTDDGKDIDHWRHLDELGCDVYRAQPLPVVRRQMQYPFPAVIRHFGGVLYTLGSPSLMLALAIWEHDQGETIRQIDSYGIDTADPSHSQQRHPWAVWTHRALDRGITMGGTSMAYLGEHDGDDGLNGLDEHIRRMIAEEQQAATATPDTSIPEVTP